MQSRSSRSRIFKVMRNSYVIFTHGKLVDLDEKEAVYWYSLAAEHAKFGTKPIISAHYLNQIKHIRDELRSANASYMLISGCDKKNFEELKDELYPFVVKDLLNLPRYNSINLLKSKDGYARFITKLPKPVS